MTEDEYRQRIEQSEEWINLELSRKQRELLCRWQSKHKAYVKNPGLITFRIEYEDLISEAKEKMSREASVIEREFYREQGFDV